MADTSTAAPSKPTAAMSVAEVVEKTKSDPRFTRGLALLKEKRYEEAVATFEDMLRTMIEVEKETESLSVAPVYYEYGHALLSLAEATASVFGSSVQPEDGDGDGDVEQEAKDTADDLQVAWEMLEIARVIYSRQAEELVVDKELARVYMRLGDIGMDREEEGLKFYVLAGHVMAENIHRVAKECGVPQVLEFVQARIPKYSHPLGESSAAESDIDDIESKGKGKQKATANGALEFLHGDAAAVRDEFLACVQVYKSQRGASDESEKVNSDNLNDLEAQLLEYLEIYAELKEKVDAIKESAQAEAVVMGAKSVAPAAGPVTTIGFGTPPPSASGAAAPVVASSSAATPAAAPSSAVNVLPVVKKRKITPQTVVPTAQDKTDA
ncbi:hypothetical protein P43SY_010182 [Pythium insidiosum]|uniref:Tetratricopeptide SHNi-TPR domain-containing protein n=1 Tax=Pythium insidiosum TaxID=114742 RepID=A0AAD5M7R4_PYTIN|nr:hypothetical protein P43SY_010182 [Pythium insidiosum]